ncbi:ComF family protein [Stutzerimonas stutzeri]|uniref:ComF family protein n=1 Tax=Stutzerimonas sp. S1 TaxID=3030652 RepID=UPI00222425F9|nr:ComF family protein [Stutzerimonas sp. S1]MCW3147386.1 ComF family protein [Stutzerimonas sp. S1]
MVNNWLNNEQYCLLCDEPCEGQPLCSPCEAELPWLDGHCAVCAVPLPTHGLTCGECLQKRPSYDHVEAPWRFAFPVDALITRFKHQARWPYGRLLGERLAHHLQHAFSDGLPRPELLLPVPLARRRLRQRGFNQAQMLAQWLGRALAIPVDERVLERIVDTPPQQQLDAATRRRNLRQAFTVSASATLEGRHLALIDDVLTTGATAEALARLLKRAGAARVDVYCLARTPKPGD